MADILKFYFHFDFDLFTVIGMWFCTGLPNCMQIGWSLTELWRHIDFTLWWHIIKKHKNRFLSHLLGDLGVTYALHL